MKKKGKVWLFLILAVVFSVLTYIVLVYSNMVNYLCGSLATLVILLFPLADLVLFILASVDVLKNKRNFMLFPCVIALIGCILGFILANDGQQAKITSDFLKNEQAFQSAAEHLIDAHGSESGVYVIDEPELKRVLPEQKAQLVVMDEAYPTYFFYAFENDRRIEGYAYLPNDLYPLEWSNTVEWSEPLDIEGLWYYIVMYK